MNVLADASLPGLNAAFPQPFKLSYYTKAEQIPKLIGQQDILLCRSTLQLNQKLLQGHSLHFIATASSGIDHLDTHFLSSQNIQIIDAKGSNASSVADYMEACLAYLTQIQALNGHSAGIIGMGAVGSEVSKRLQALNFQVFPYDPLKAEREPDFQSATLDQLFSCDLLCIHAEQHKQQPYPSVNLINARFLKQLNPNCLIINAARGGLVNEQDLLKATQAYCTDVYLNEPELNEQLIERCTLCTPHIAGHSLEAKYAAVAMISEKLHQILGLAIPKYALPDLSQLKRIQPGLSWQDRTLSIYNPIEETRALKQATDKKAAFLQLRQNHNQRHDFSLYV